MIHKHLRAVGGELGGFGGALVLGLAVDGDICEGDAAATDGDAVHRLVDDEVSRPAVFAVDAQGGEVRLGVADLLRRRFNVQRLHADL
jgi:hypothetical protein